MERERVTLYLHFANFFLLRSSLASRSSFLPLYYCFSLACSHLKYWCSYRYYRYCLCRESLLVYRADMPCTKRFT